MDKQYNLFAKEDEVESKYSSKIEAPIYEPKNQQPHLLSLCDKSKTLLLIRNIEASNLPNDEKVFLIDAAQRHIVFNYESIADYYAHASKEMQGLMEKSALVIIDFDKAIEYGYVKLCSEIREQYLQEYAD
tara:strand:+ start:249 stop:641 length:393 start_codon:yes stop_codon:yes gene_type:complete